MTQRRFNITAGGHAPISEVPRLGRRCVPLVVLAVLILERRGRKLSRRRVIEAGEVDPVELAQLFGLAMAERLDAAAAAEHVADDAAAELVLRHGVGALQQPEGVGLDDRLPEPALGADRAVALAGALREVDVAGEADGAAMAAAVIGLVHGRTYSGLMSASLTTLPHLANSSW